MFINSVTFFVSVLRPVGIWRVWKSGVWLEPIWINQAMMDRMPFKWWVSGTLTEKKAFKIMFLIHISLFQARAVGKKEVVAFLVQLMSNKAKVTTVLCSNSFNIFSSFISALILTIIVSQWHLCCVLFNFRKYSVNLMNVMNMMMMMMR